MTITMNIYSNLSKCVENIKFIRHIQYYQQETGGNINKDWEEWIIQSSKFEKFD